MKPDRTLAIQYVRLYTSYKKVIADRRDIIINGTPEPSVGKSNLPGDPTGRKVDALLRLEKSHRARVVRAVEKARKEIGEDVESRSERQALNKAIWRSCLHASDNPYALYGGGLSFSKSDFYRRRRRFLDRIVELLDD